MTDTKQDTEMNRAEAPHDVKTDVAPTNPKTDEKGRDKAQKAQKKAPKPTMRTNKSDKPHHDKKPLTLEQKALYRKIGCAAALVVAGGVCGAGLHMLMAPSGATGLTGATEVAKDKLNTAVGTYTIDGQTTTVTARDALITAGALTENENGSYDMPTVENILTLARSAAMSKAADERGIKVSDDEIKAYVTDTFGTDDLKAAADVYGYTEDELKTMVSDAIKSQKLYEDVTGNKGGVGVAPSRPDEGIDGAAAAEYIIKVAGSDWDADKGAFVKDSAIGNAVGEFDGKTATESQATAAYDAAYQKWSETMNDVITKWDDFCRETYKDLTITVATGIA